MADQNPAIGMISSLGMGGKTFSKNIISVTPASPSLSIIAKIHALMLSMNTLNL
ncbi:hypothetical protein LP090_03030 [Moraxella bovis]|uniref:hypothetical protein n=1 Tax=Moraxella bovis TaxID=476 RepID=UPI002227CFA2|nr:hypothetical protein [Moraxella bovis]UYZ80595.1 hypothetical protein LP113_11250 [Moraxella bovis]UYZ94791.1 hypothetical protein LP121_13165 [Moraxella bovis]UZA43589.1 hypothetical protein LP090_03030 [Moraxella bovis]